MAVPSGASTTEVGAGEVPEFLSGGDVGAFFEHRFGVGPAGLEVAGGKGVGRFEQSHGGIVAVAVEGVDERSGFGEASEHDQNAGPAQVGIALEHREVLGPFEGAKRPGIVAGAGEVNAEHEMCDAAVGVGLEDFGDPLEGGLGATEVKLCVGEQSPGKTPGLAAGVGELDPPKQVRPGRDKKAPLEQVGDEVSPGGLMPWIDGEGLLVGFPGALNVVLGIEGEAQVGPSFVELGVEGDGVPEVGFGLLGMSLVELEGAEVGVGFGEARMELQGQTKTGFGVFEFACIEGLRATLVLQHGLGGKGSCCPTGDANA